VANVFLLSGRTATAVCLLTVCLMTVAMLAARLKRKRAAWPVALALAALGFLAAKEFAGRGGWSAGLASFDRPGAVREGPARQAMDEQGIRGLAERLVLWECAWEIVKRNPVCGVGTGDVKTELIKVYAEKKFGKGVEAAYNPHNQYLQTAAALGLPGLAGLLALALAPLVRSVRRRHFLFLNFLLIVGLNSLTESVLEVQAGVLFVALFYLLLGREGKDGSPPPG
jgi:O-antigen ligase